MLKKLVIITGILIVAIALYILLIKFSVADTAVANKEKQVTLITKEEEQEISILNRVTEKIHEKYVGVDVKTTSKKELMIRVVGDEEYYNSVKKDMESIAKSVIKSSPLKNHKVVFERWDLFRIPEEFNKADKENHHLRLLMEVFKDYEVVINISANDQKSIIIHTSIKSSDKDAHKLSLKIEETVSKILHSKELNSNDSYEIKILDANGQIIK
ncbi:hypothetical protein ACQKNC_06235 [Lysinibacillus sp. NPDC094177]|uniref:hypothetical protein n=1 Tax=Lysinibacillus sp. NPDC094177 TaxID=3390580 RepID=UPI003D0594AF